MIVTAQGAPDEIQVRRIVTTRSARRDTERFLLRREGVIRLHDTALPHELEHEVAPRARTIRMPARIVIRRTPHNRHEQRHFRQIELGQGLTEVELARQAKSMNRAVAVLAEENLVDVGVHQVRLAEIRIEGHRHDGLAHLASERAPRIEEVAFDELLGQRAAALLHLPGTHVHPHCTRDPNRIDTVMRIKLPVLDRRQGLRQ